MFMVSQIYSHTNFMFSTKNVDKQNHYLDNFNIYPIGSIFNLFGKFYNSYWFLC